MPAPTYEHYHVFSIPSTILDVLTPLNLRSSLSPPVTNPVGDSAAAVVPREPPQDAAGAQEALGSRACNVCLGASFADVDAQRSHFRSDWHRYNVKLRLSGGQPVGVARFGQLVEGLDDSLSGSASSTSDENDGTDTDDAVSTLLSRTRLHKPTRSRSPSPDATTRIQSAVAWFHAPPARQLGVYKALFPTPSASDALGELRSLQRDHGPAGRSWALFLVAGGHFAGAVVRVSRSDDEVAEDEETEERAREARGSAQDGDPAKRKKKAKPRKPKPETELLLHKTFHRYTTRKKQGGSQSTNDNAKHKAKSAGAQLRRYGEQALREDIQGLLREWADEIGDCERIWIRASVSNRRMLMEENGGIFEKGDDRLRGFPFPTRRPTQSELLRCLTELVRVKVTNFTEEELREQDDAYLASLPKPRPKPPSAPAPATTPQPTAPPKTTLTAAQEEQRAKWLRALDMVAHGRLDALRGLMDKDGPALGGVDARVPTWMGLAAGGDDAEERARGRTLLMAAAAGGQDALVAWLLDDAGADPTLDVPPAGVGAPPEPDAGPAEIDDGNESDGAQPAPASGRRTAYDLARARTTRDAFRRAAGGQPDRWDWLGVGPGGARVPSVLTREMEEGRGERKKARRRGLKDKLRERETREREAAPSPPPATAPPALRKEEPKGGPQKLGGVATAGEGIAGLTPEMRAKVERERRARAAEARMKALSGR